MRARIATAVAVLAGTAGLVLASATQVGAATDGSGTAQVRVAHLSPDTEGVDVYLDGAAALSNVGFRTVTDYASVPAGTHHVELRPHAAAVDSKPVLAADLTFDAGKAYTVAGLGLRRDLHGAVFDDDRSAPPAGQARVRLIHAALDVSTVDVKTSEGRTLFSKADFGKATSYEDVAPGQYSLTVDRTGTDEQVVDSAPPIDVSPGIVYTIAAIGGAGTPVRLLPVVDARGATGALPTTGPATGAGGTAPRRAPDRDGVDPVWALAALAWGGVVLLLAAKTRRERAHLAS
jgi:hypothetical protein